MFQHPSVLGTRHPICCLLRVLPRCSQLYCKEIHWNDCPSSYAMHLMWLLLSTVNPLYWMGIRHISLQKKITFLWPPWHKTILHAQIIVNEKEFQEKMTKISWTPGYFPKIRKLLSHWHECSIGIHASGCITQRLQYR